MATAEQVKALIRSYAEGDEERFYAVALQVAARAARQGHAKLAQDLRTLVEQAREKAKREALVQRTRPVPVVQPRGDLADLLTASYPKIRLSDLVLDDLATARLKQVLREQRNRHRLLDHGFAPARKLLLVGPPGTGKTMTASALAGELSIPLFTLRLDGLITKYLGETAAKLRVVFDAISQTRGIYFFDEFDALGGERAATNEVGEIRRVLNSFLQFLEADESDSLIIAATNYPSLLDRALFRRFDLVVEYALPSPTAVEALLRARLCLLDTSGINWHHVVKEAEGLSHADITRACEQAAKNAILGGTRAVLTDDLLAALRDRKQMYG